MSLRKFSTPCWYYNNGGCTKSAAECTYTHVNTNNIRKPLNIQHPCRFYHYVTPGRCPFGSTCKGDHSYELTLAEWKHHFPKIPYPGEDYINPQIDSKDGFVIYNLEQPENKQVVGQIWNHKYGF
jgi:hypothetical protein